MRPELLQLVCSIASQRRRAIREMDIKPAFLQADGFSREAYVKPPKEGSDSKSIWRLSKAARGLVDSGRLWRLTSDQSFVDFGLSRSAIDLSLRYKLENGLLVFAAAVQVDNYICAGAPEATEAFEKRASDRLAIGECLHSNFEVYGCRATQLEESIAISQKKRLSGLRGYDLRPARAARGSDEATDSEQAARLSIIGSLLLIGAVASPAIGRMASQLAARSSSLQVKGVKALSSAAKRCKSLSAQVALLAAPPVAAQWAVFADASRAAATSASSHQGALMLRAFGLSSSAVAHPIGWLARRARRIARSALAAESISCADGFDLRSRLSAICKELTLQPPARLITGSKSLRELISTTRDPAERRLKLDIAALRQSFDNGELRRMSWAPSKLQLADALAKGNRESSSLLGCALSGGRLRDDYADALAKSSDADPACAAPA